MPEQRSFGVECKNPECHTGIILGDYLTNPQHPGDMISFVDGMPGTVRCPVCGQEYEYTQEDLREFPDAES